MKMTQLGNAGIQVPAIALGCMRMSRKTPSEAAEVIEQALELGINFFDHADIYGTEKGLSEIRFKEALKELPDVKREEILLQSKVGIRDGYYDFSKEHILNGVDNILKRLGTDYLDVLLLHRPDALVEPEEVAEAFDELEASGKVKQFGVSNHTPLQIELLKQYVKQELVVNQLQFSVMHTGIVDQGLNMNRKLNESIDRDNGILDYSRIHKMTVQPWSPVRAEDGVFLNNSDYEEINTELSEVGSRYGINNEAAAIAWLLRHPSRMQVVLGTMNKERLANYAKAADVKFTRKEWYGIYQKAGNYLP